MYKDRVEKFSYSGVREDGQCSSVSLAVPSFLAGGGIVAFCVPLDFDSLSAGGGAAAPGTLEQ